MTHANTRAKILKAARDLYLKEGSKALSMRRVGKHVGISAAAIYKHFTDKEHLLLEVCQEGFELFGMEMMKGLRGRTPEERLALTARGYVRFALLHPAYYRILFGSPHPDFADLKREANAAYSPAFHLLADRVSECQRAGLVHTDRAPDAVALEIWAHVHGAIMLWLDGHLDWLESSDAFEAFCVDYTSRYLHALTP